jgi:hypothetical protein
MFPLDVTGLPVTVKAEGMDKPTEVTPRSRLPCMKV